MKNRLFALAFLALLAVACEQPVDPTPKSDEVRLTSATTLTVGADGGTAEITFTSSDAWTAALANDRVTWLSINPASGTAGQSTVTVTVDPNDTPDDRSATIRVKCGNATASVTLTQKQKDALTQSPSKTQFDAEGGNFTIEVKANIEYSFEIDGDWIHQSSTRAITTKTTTFTVDKNEDTRKREGSVTVKSALGNEKITIYQEAASPTIVLSADDVPVKTDGGTFTVDVNTNVDVTMTITEGAEWLSEVTTRSMSTHTYTFQATANETTDSRVGRITFRNADTGVEASVTVTQMQKNALVVAQSLYEIGVDGGNISIETSANIDLEVAISESWVHQASTRAMTTRTYDFTVDANPGYDIRECTITFTGGAGESPFSQQSPWSLIGSMGGDTWTRDIEMKTDGKWHVALAVPFAASDEFKFRKDKDWDVNLGSNSYSVTTYPGDCIAVLAQGGGNMKLPAGTFDIYLNPDQNRAYFLTAGTPFTYDGYTAQAGGLTQTVTVRQDGVDGFIPDFKDQYTISSLQQTLELRSRSSVDVVAESKCDWISVVKTKALTDRAITLQIAENTSNTSRTGEVVINVPALGQSHTVTITQKGAGEMYIPDAAFYGWLLSQFDENHDGDLSKAECDKVTGIEWTLNETPGVKSVQGLEYFPNLEYLRFYWSAQEGGADIEVIDLSGNPKLRQVHLNHLPNLKSLTIDSSDLADLTLIGCPSLTGMDNFSRFKNLQLLYLYDCPWLTTLDCSGNSKLYYLSVNTSPSLAKIIAPCPKLQHLYIGDCPSLSYSNIILPQDTFDLTYLSIDTIDSVPEEIDLSMCPALKQISISSRSEYWSIKTIWLMTGITLPDLYGFARDAEIRYKGENLLVPVEFVSTAFRDMILKNNQYYDVNQDGELSAYELSKINYLVIFSDWFTLDETITSLEDIGHLKNLEHFGLLGFGNKVSAPIPESLKTLERLESFSLSDCRVQGTLPEWIAEMPSLTELDLRGSYPLGGDVPSAILTSDKWVYLDLSGCAFSGATIIVPAASLLDYDSKYYPHAGRFFFSPQHEKVLRETQEGGSYVYDYPNILYQSDVDGTGAVHPDGEAVLYHAATKGPGIDLIITGDGFSAENNTIGGTLETYMTACAETFLQTDPYDKLAEYYNVWLVYAHSRTAGTGVLSWDCTKFGTWHENPGQASIVNGKHTEIVAFMNSVLGKDCRNAVIAVLMNSSTYGGTCYSSYYSLNSWQYTLAYTPVHPDYGGFISTFVHETLGHGIGKLADEYNADMSNPGSAPSTYPYWTNYGQYANVDNVSDPSTIRWHNFLSDARYAGEGLGVFEGAFYANTGWYRPSANSVMRDQFGEGGDHFNAPSRESIYQWTLFRAYGGEREWADWPSFLAEYYDYESFVAFDKAPSPSPAPRRIRKASRAPEKIVLFDGRVIERKLPPHTPPVFVHDQE